MQWKTQKATFPQLLPFVTIPAPAAQCHQIEERRYARALYGTRHCVIVPKRHCKTRLLCARVVMRGGHKHKHAMITHVKLWAIFRYGKFSPITYSLACLHILLPHVI